MIKINTMKSISKAKEEFEQKVSELAKVVQPSLCIQNLNEVVLYEKMLEMQEQITKLSLSFEKK